jgi:predicted Zn-dependent protease
MKNRESVFQYRLTILFFMILLLTGCAAVLQPVENDKELGRETYRKVEIDMGIYSSRKSAMYLNRIGEDVVRANPDKTFDYNFTIIDQYVPNAFALPGGYICISRGLLALTNSEDELAGVIGHEIVHISRRHSARQMAKASVPALLALPGALVKGVINENLGNLLMAPASIFGGGYLSFHGRQDEFESDQLGQLLAAEAGYDPAALAPILERLEAFSEMNTGQKRIPGFFDTHPSTPDRVDRVKRDAANIDWQRQSRVAKNSADYLKHLDGLLVGENPSMGVIQGQNFLHPELDLFIKLPQDWKLINTHQALYAVAPKKDGLLVIGVAGKGTDPGQAAEQFKNELYKKQRAEPNVSKPLKVGNLPGYLLTYTDASGKEPMHMRFLWISYKGLIYQFIGLAPERYRPVLKKTALSFRPLSNKEKRSILETRLRVVQARSGETLKRLSKRTKNIWNTNITAVVNGLDISQRLKKGQLVKIAVSQPYTGGKSTSKL